MAKPIDNANRFDNYQTYELLDFIKHNRQAAKEATTNGLNAAWDKLADEMQAVVDFRRLSLDGEVKTDDLYDVMHRGWSNN